MVKKPPVMQETWVHSLGREDPLEEGKATHSSTLAWRIPGTEEPCRLQSMMSVHDVPTSWARLSAHTAMHTYINLSIIGTTFL